MNKCQFQVQTIKRMANTVSSEPILPDGYQRVEYIQNGWRAWIDTSVPLTNTYYVSVKYMLTQNNVSWLWGDRGVQWVIGGYGVNNQRLYLSNNYYATGMQSQTDTPYELTYYYDSPSGTYKAYQNGTELTYGSTSGLGNNNGFSLFASHDLYAVGRICSVLIKESIDGNTTLDAYACYRKSDNKPGMYDLVTNTFFTNVGSGDFTVGPDI